MVPRAWRVCVLLGLSACLPLASAQEGTVGITPNLPHVDVVHEGRKVRIQRHLPSRAAGTEERSGSRATCPPSCLQPMRAAPGIETVGELELLEFLRTDVATGQGVLVDARLAERYRFETLPSAVSIPFAIVKPDNPHIGRILSALGGRKSGADWDFSAARSLLIFCDGPFSDEARTSIEVLLAMRYPASKIRYYRGGLQAWRLSGLTTVIPASTP
jgi:Rhodanese-like domain